MAPFFYGVELLQSLRERYHCDADSTAVSDHSFEKRIDFVTIGNFRHAPNSDSVRLLIGLLWPAIRARLPDARLWIYGAYADTSIHALQDRRAGVMVGGAVADVHAALAKHRVMLAPLRYGAGVKGVLHSIRVI